MSGRKKLLLFSHVSNARNITGAEKLLLFMTRKFSDHFDCTIVAPHEGRLTQLAREFGIRIVIRDIPLLYGMCMPYERLYGDAEVMLKSRATAQTVGLLREERPDWVFVNTSVNVIPAMAAKLLGIPVVWHITEIVANNGCTGQAIAVINRYSDRVVGISQTAVSPFYGTPVELKLSLLYPSWGHEEYKRSQWTQLGKRKRWEWGIRPDERVVGYISSFLIEQKGPLHFIQAAAIAGKAHPEARFVIIGGELDRDFYRSLKMKVKESGCERQFLFLDHQDNIEAAYCTMDIVVIPSLVSEGFGMTAMEAMLFGKPVVAYASGGLNEILELTGNGDYLVPTGDIPGLAAKVSELLASPERAESVGLRNSSRVESAFGPDSYSGRFKELISCMLHLPPGPRLLPELTALSPSSKSSRLRRPAKKARRKRPTGSRSSGKANRLAAVRQRLRRSAGRGLRGPGRSRRRRLRRRPASSRPKSVNEHTRG